MIAILIRFWPYIAIGALAAAAALFYANWQTAVHNTGVWQERHRQASDQSTALKKQLALANDKVIQTAKAGAVSYGHCQDLAATDASLAFDKGTLFGRSTCASLRSPPASASPPAPRPSPR